MESFGSFLPIYVEGEIVKGDMAKGVNWDGWLG